MLAQAHSGISPSGGGLGCQNREPTAALSCDRGEFGPDRIRDGGTVGGNFWRASGSFSATWRLVTVAR